MPAHILRLSHTYGCQFPVNSSCKLRMVRPLRAAPASCAWCDKEELQHTSFLLMTMPGWTCMHTITTRATQPWKVFKAASLAPKTDEDWHTQMRSMRCFFVSVLHRLLTWRACTWRTSRTTRTSRAPSPETSLPSFVTSLTAVVSSLRRFSGPRPLTLSLFNLAHSVDSTSEFYFSICFLWEAYRDCFHNFSFSLRFFFLEVSHVEGSSLTTSLHYQTSAFYEISKPKVD
jgi:hypothetical protein